MNAFNRVLAVLFALLLITAAAGTLLVSAEVLAPSWFAVDCPLYLLSEQISALTGGERITTQAVAGVVLLAGILLLVLELRSLRPRAQTFEITQSEHGRISVEPAGICRLMERVASALTGVVACRADVKERDGAISGHCVLSTTSDSAVKGVATEAQALISRAVADQIGIEFADLEIRIRITNESSPEPKRTVE